MPKGSLGEVPKTKTSVLAPTSEPTIAGMTNQATRDRTRGDANPSVFVASASYGFCSAITRTTEDYHDTTLNEASDA